MDSLFATISTPSYLPTPSEVLEGVRWLRENPAIAAGVMVGLTSYSVAKYYECLEDKPIDIAESSEPEQEQDQDSNGETISKEEIARSVSAIQLGLMSMNMRGSGVTESSSGSASSSSSGMRSRASSIFNQTHVVRSLAFVCSGGVARPLTARFHCDQNAAAAAFPDELVAAVEGQSANCSFCNGDASSMPCCDPNWGWFVPTSPSHKRV